MDICLEGLVETIGFPGHTLCVLGIKQVWGLQEHLGRVCGFPCFWELLWQGSGPCGRTLGRSLGVLK